MAIQIFEKDYSESFGSTIETLLHDAGFTDVSNSGSDGDYSVFSSSSGVYGVNSFSMYTGGTGKYIAVKDDSQKALIVFKDGTISSGADIARTSGYSVFELIIVNGVMCDRPNTNPMSLYYNAVGGLIKSASDTTQAMLAPFIDINGHVFKPFYISMNRVNYNINTVVTDGVNSFTSLGNLFYIKEQGSTSITATANDWSKVSASDTLTVTSTPAQTETVDVYIGDSTTAIWDTAPEDKNWTTLISNADGVGRVNVAVVGSGFTNDAGKKAAFPAQVTTAVVKTRGKTVRRVFLVGLSNDVNYIQSDPSGEMNAMTKTADAIKSAWPGSQLLYIPEVAPQTDYSTSMVAKYSSTINQVYTLFEGKGFNVARNWFDWMPNGKENRYMHDTIHPNAKAMNVAAHKIREWVNTLSGPKITGEIPAWSE